METAKSCSAQHLKQIKEGWNSVLDKLYRSVDFIKKQSKKFVGRFKEHILKFNFRQKRPITGFTQIYYVIFI